MKGSKSEDGTVSRLTHRAQLVFLAGKDKVRAALSESGHMFHWCRGGFDIVPGPDCEDEDACDKIAGKHFEVAMTTVSVTRALGPWKESYGVGLCGHCATVASKDFEAGKRTFWNSLWEFFLDVDGFPYDTDLHDLTC
jgi:hypothetical protein